MQNLEYSDGSKEDMDQKTIDAIVQSQHDRLFSRVCQEAYVEAQQSLQLVPDGNRFGGFQAECSNYRGEKNVEND